jgi:hypothetical protein
MTQEKLTLHRIWFMTNYEAEQAVEHFRLLEGCIDVYADTYDVAVYTQRTVKQAMLRSLLEDYSYPPPLKYLQPSVIPLPDFLPEQLVRLLWYFPGVVSGSRVRIIHLYYSGGEYRYQVMDEATKKVGWVDSEGLEPLDTTPGTDG